MDFDNKNSVFNQQPIVCCQLSKKTLMTAWDNIKYTVQEIQKFIDNYKGIDEQQDNSMRSIKKFYLANINDRFNKINFDISIDNFDKSIESFDRSISGIEDQIFGLFEALGEQQEKANDMEKEKLMKQKKTLENYIRELKKAYTKFSIDTLYQLAKKHCQLLEINDIPDIQCMHVLKITDYNSVIFFDCFISDKLFEKNVEYIYEKFKRAMRKSNVNFKEISRTEDLWRASSDKSVKAQVIFMFGTIGLKKKELEELFDKKKKATLNSIFTDIKLNESGPDAEILYLLLTQSNNFLCAPLRVNIYKNSTNIVKFDWSNRDYDNQFNQLIKNTNEWLLANNVSCKLDDADSNTSNRRANV